jgi:hypothetical protein
MIQQLPGLDITNRDGRLYILRYSRATYLAKHLTETCVLSSDRLLGGWAEYKLKSLKCKTCSETSPTMNFLI